MRLSFEIKSSRTSALPVARDKSASIFGRQISNYTPQLTFCTLLTSLSSVCVFLANCLKGIKSSAWITAFLVSFSFF